MAHFAKIEAGTVTQVVVVANTELMENGLESEAEGVAFLRSLFGADGDWVQTSYNGTIRKNFAGVGFNYDRARDAFIEPQPFASWTLDEATCRWQAPTAQPDDGRDHVWNEEMQQWR